MWSYLASIGLAVLLQDAAAPPLAKDGGFGSILWLILGIGIGIVIGLLLSKAYGKSRGETEEKDTSQLSIYTPPTVAAAAVSGVPNAKRCPKCNSTYTDGALIYCVSDGATLVGANNPRESDSDATMLYRESPK
ncbi:MAG: hypothetical protein QOJ64_1849 [Acidobacteriota bacterium]|jgi:hypothetical protein|nr:hypothetical protein [Acidobacteriota bacterium]